MYTWDVLKDNVKISQDIVDNYRTMFESRISSGRTEKLPYSENLRISSWSYDVEGHAKKSTTLQSIYSMHWWPPLERTRNEICWRIVTSMLPNCSKMAFAWHEWEDLIFYGQWINLQDPPQNGLKPVTNTWLDWFLSFIIRVNINNIVMWVILQKQCRLGLFQDSDFAGDLEDSKSTSEGTLCVFGSHTFVPTSWMCKKQTSVSRSSTESEITSLDAGLRLDGIPALDLWDRIVSVSGNMTQTSERPGRPVIIDRSQWSQGKTNVLNNIDCVPSNVPVFASRSFVVCVWGQRSSDQDDH